MTRTLYRLLIILLLWCVGAALLYLTWWALYQAAGLIVLMWMAV